MNRAALIEQLNVTQETLGKLLALLESSEADKFVAHLYQARKHCRQVCERPNKGNKAIEREVLSSYQIAQSLGFNGDFHAWEHLLRTHGNLQDQKVKSPALVATLIFGDSSISSQQAQPVLGLRSSAHCCSALRCNREPSDHPALHSALLARVSSHRRR